MYVYVFHFVTDVLHSEHSYMTFLTWQGPNMTSTDDKSRCKPAQKFITGSGGCSTREETEEVTRSLLSVAIWQTLYCGNFRSLDAVQAFLHFLLLSQFHKTFLVHLFVFGIPLQVSKNKNFTHLNYYVINIIIWKRNHSKAKFTAKICSHYGFHAIWNSDVMIMNSI